MLRYDEAAVVQTLARVSIKLRVAFAASCAERLFPAYTEFCNRAARGDQAALADVLQQVWQHLLDDKMSVDQVRLALSRCMALIPGKEGEPWVDEQAYADDAASATAYTLRALDDGEPQESALAASRAYEAAGYHVIHRLGIDSDPHVLAHPIVQRELSRQRRDLEEVLEAREESPELLVRFRDRARSEASTFFASES